MTKTVKITRLALGQALAAGMLAAMVGLFWFDGPAPVFAQDDTTPPTVSSIAITSDTGDDESYWEDDGIYGIGDGIEVTVTFSENVRVTGTPRLELDIGGASKSAEYESTQGSAVVFSYTVAEGDADSDGIAVEADKLTLNGGGIKDEAENVANLSHNTLADQGGHRVDGIRPTISRIHLMHVFQGGRLDGFYTVGKEIFVDVDFSERTHISGGTQLTLDFDGTAKTSEWTGGWLGSFSSYVVQEGDLDTDGVAIGANAISLNGGTIRDRAGNDGVLTHGAVAADSDFKVDAVVPTVSSIAITSDPGDDDTYGAGDRIEVTVTFSENVSVPDVTRSDLPGTHRPQLELDVGGEARIADYQNQGGAGVVFGYSVRAGDSDENGIAIGASKLWLNGGVIEDAAGNNPISAELNRSQLPPDAVVSHDAVSDDAGHKVDVPSSPLTLSGDSTLHVRENSSRYVAGYRVSGTDGSLTWSLSGDDSDEFEIFSGGTVKWVSSPNYEDPTDADTDNQYRVTIQASDGTNEAKLQVTVVVTNIPLDTDEVPTVTGTAQVGETLTADTSLISFYSYSLGPWYFWLRSDGTTDTEIEGARGNSSYTLVAADEGYTIKVRVNFYNYDLVSLTSEPTAVVAANPNSLANSPATGAPIISGAAYVGNTLTADTSGISDADGLTNGTFGYQWIRNDRTTDADISGATGATYTLVEADEGRNVKVRANFTDDAGNQESLTSAPTVPVTVRATPLTGLTVNPGTLAPAFHSYTFNYTVPDVANSDRRITVNATVKDGYEYEIAPVAESGLFIGVTDPWSLSGWDISDGSGGTFEPLTDADAESSGFQMDLDEGENHFAIRVYRGVGDFGEFYRLMITRAPGLPDAPQRLNVSPHESGALDLYWEAPASDGGSEITGYRVQWKEAAGSWNTAADVSETTVTGTTHTITGLTDGVEYTVRVIAVNDLGDSDPSGEATGTPRETDPPGLSTATVDGATLTLTYDEALDEGSPAEAGAFAVTVGGAARAVNSVSMSGNVVTLTLASAVAAGEEVTVSYTAPAEESTARIRDLAGNAAPSFNGQAAANDTQAPATLTASIHDEPDRHDGETAFTFELKFSEEPHPDFSYVTLRDHAFTVTSGRVSGVRRLAPPSNVGWEIHVTPDGSGAVTVVLPVTTVCTVQGAICTQDRRPLSQRLEVMVPGPGQAQQASPNSPATGQPAITGTAQVGETLTAGTSGISDADGLTNVSYAYQWLGDDASISGATGSSYTVVSADEGKTIKVRVSFTDDAGNRETVTSAATVAVAGRPNYPATGVPAITGTAQVGETLTADTSGISDADGLTNATFRYQWLADDAGISGATSSSYTVADGDEGKAIKVTVTFTDDAGNRESVTSAATGAVVARPNSPATGQPAITGTAQEDQTLTADTSGIVDTDGLTNVSYAYQWLADDAAIANADAPTYTLTSAEQGKAIKVTVTFTDDAGNQESVTSEATVAVAARPNSPATGEPAITGTAQMGQTLTADTSGISDDDGLGNAVFGYRWLADDSAIANADAQTYTLTSTEQGKAIKVTVTFTDDAGNQETLTSAATVAVAGRPNSPATGAPAITGTARVGETLTAGTSGIDDSDGLTNATFTYQWLGDDADISGATGSSYTLADADEGQAIKVRVSFTDDAGNAETVTSAATVAAAARPNSPATGAPAISGTAQVGETLTASTSGISDGDGLTNATFTYQWLADDAGISGATGSSYTPADAEAGKAIKVRVSFTDDAGNAETVTSAAISAVAARPNSPATGQPAITGTAEVGETLTASTSGISDSDGLTNATFSYQWLADDAAINGADASTYTLSAAEEGKAIRVTVTFTDDAGNDESVTSEATGAVEAAVAGAPAPVWSVEMTVVHFGHGDVGAATADLFSNETGSLSIVWLWYSARNRELHLDFTGPVADAEELTLHLDDVALAFPAGSSGRPSFTFSDVDISWTEGQTVAVSVVR